MKKLILFFALFSAALHAIDSCDQVNAMCLQSDAKSIVVGLCLENAQQAASIARLTALGVLDGSYGIGGFAFLSLGLKTEALGVLMDATDQTEICGASDMQAFVARFDINGVIDPIFGASSGYTLVTYGEGISFAGLANNGSYLYAAGWGVLNGQCTIIVARFSVTGILDLSFGVDGIRSYAPGNVSLAYGITSDSTGRLLIGGTADDQAVVLAIDANGDLVPGFGSSGVATLFQGSIYDLSVDATDRILCVGISAYQSIIARLTTAGIFDPTFNTTGYASFVLGQQSQFNGIKLDASSCPVVTGISAFNSGTSIVVARYTTSGLLDASFNTIGYLQLEICKKNQGKDVAVPSGSQILVASRAGAESTVLAYHSNGTVDTAYGTVGRAALPSTLSCACQACPTGATGATGPSSLVLASGVSAIKLLQGRVSTVDGSYTGLGWSANVVNGATFGRAGLSYDISFVELPSVVALPEYNGTIAAFVGQMVESENANLTGIDLKYAISATGVKADTINFIAIGNQ